MSDCSRNYTRFKMFSLPISPRKKSLCFLVSVCVASDPPVSNFFFFMFFFSVFFFLFFCCETMSNCSQKLLDRLELCCAVFLNVFLNIHVGLQSNASRILLVGKKKRLPEKRASPHWFWSRPMTRNWRYIFGGGGGGGGGAVEWVPRG